MATKAKKAFPEVRVVSRAVKKNPGFTKRSPAEAAEHRAKIMRESNSAAIEYLKGEERVGNALTYFVLISKGTGAYTTSSDFALNAGFVLEKQATEYIKTQAKLYPNTVFKLVSI